MNEKINRLMSNGKYPVKIIIYPYRRGFIHCDEIDAEFEFRNNEKDFLTFEQALNVVIETLEQDVFVEEFEKGGIDCDGIKKEEKKETLSRRELYHIDENMKRLGDELAGKLTHHIMHYKLSIPVTDVNKGEKFMIIDRTGYKKCRRSSSGNFYVGWEKERRLFTPGNINVYKEEDHDILFEKFCEIKREIEGRLKK